MSRPELDEQCLGWLLPKDMAADADGRPLSEWGTSYAQEAAEDIAELRGRIPCVLRCAGEESPRRAKSKRRPGLDWYDNLEAGRNSIRFWKITGGRE